MLKTITHVEYTNRHNPLYSVILEDGPGAVADFDVIATTKDGNRYVHATAHELGWGCDEDGVPHPINHSPTLDRLVARIQNRGSIDLRYWSPIGE